MVPNIAAASPIFTNLRSITTDYVRLWENTTNGKDSFDPDLGGAAGFEPLADPGRPCWRERVTELVQDRYGVLVVRAFAFGHEVITCGLGGKPVE